MPNAPMDEWYALVERWSAAKERWIKAQSAVNAKLVALGKNGNPTEQEIAAAESAREEMDELQEQMDDFCDKYAKAP